MGLDGLDDLYRGAILDHRRHPRNRDKLDEADVTADGVNPFCGDEIHLQIKLDEHGRVAHVGLQAEGCALNQATGSMLTEAIEGKTLQKIDALAHVFSSMMQGEPHSQEELTELGDLETLSGVRQFPIRIKCALLAWDTLDEGIEEYRRAHHG